MSIFDPIIAMFSRGSLKGDMQAGPGQLPSPPPVKAPNRASTIPSFKTQVARATSLLARPDKALANTDAVTFRQGADTRQVIRDYAQASPDLSATKNAYLRVGIPESYTVIARDMDGAVNPEATKLAQEILRRVTFLGDYSLGYNPSTDLQGISEALGGEGLLYGAMALELVLDKQRQPVYFQPVSVATLRFKEEDGGVYPVQIIGGEEIDLDIPTFFYVSIDQNLLTAYSSSYFEAAIQSVIADSQFLNDLRRSMQRVIQPRLIARIIEEKVKTSLPPDVVNDNDKVADFYNRLISELTETLSGLNPEDALVGFDNVEYKLMGVDGGSSGSIADTLSAVQKLIESKLAAGAKTMPAILGRDSTGTAATTSAMLFLKNADVIRRKLNTIYSRALTVAVRLSGQDCYVDFKYEKLDLRPDGELEAYKSMKQSRVLELLSLGLIDDVTACIELTGQLPREGFTPLAGTMFKSAKTETANPNSQTSTMNGSRDNLKSDQPAAPKGS